MKKIVKKLVIISLLFSISFVSSGFNNFQEKPPPIAQSHFVDK